MSNTNRITALRTEIRTAEHAVMTAATPYVVEGRFAGGQGYRYGVDPKVAAQASLDALCRQLGQLTDDA